MIKFERPLVDERGVAKNGGRERREGEVKLVPFRRESLTMICCGKFERRALVDERGVGKKMGAKKRDAEVLVFERVLTML